MNFFFWEYRVLGFYFFQKEQVAFNFLHYFLFYPCIGLGLILWVIVWVIQSTEGVAEGNFVELLLLPVDSAVLQLCGVGPKLEIGGVCEAVGGLVDP